MKITEAKQLFKKGKIDWEDMLEFLIAEEAKCVNGKGKCYLNDIYQFVNDLIDVHTPKPLEQYIKEVYPTKAARKKADKRYQKLKKSITKKK